MPGRKRGLTVGRKSAAIKHDEMDSEPMDVDESGGGGGGCGAGGAPAAKQLKRGHGKSKPNAEAVADPPPSLSEVVSVALGGHKLHDAGGRLTGLALSQSGRVLFVHSDKGKRLIAYALDGRLTPLQSWTVDSPTGPMTCARVSSLVAPSATTLKEWLIVSRPRDRLQCIDLSGVSPSHWHLSDALTGDLKPASDRAANVMAMVAFNRLHESSHWLAVARNWGRGVSICRLSEIGAAAAPITAADTGGGSGGGATASGSGSAGGGTIMGSTTLSLSVVTEVSVVSYPTALAVVPAALLSLDADVLLVAHSHGWPGRVTVVERPGTGADGLVTDAKAQGPPPRFFNLVSGCTTLAGSRAVDGCVMVLSASQQSHEIDLFDFASGRWKHSIKRTVDHVRWGDISAIAVLDNDRIIVVDGTDVLHVLSLN